MTEDARRKRLIFRSWHRGTKEMDLLLGSFADKYVPGFSEEELRAYEEILTVNDPDLYSWITAQAEPPANLLSDVFRRLRDHKFA